MNLLVGDRNRWHLASIDGRNPIAVRPAVRELLADDNPIADLLDRICDEIDRRVQSRRERLQSPYRRWLDYRLVRMAYRALKAKETPEIAWWEHLDGPIVRGLSWVVMGFGAAYFIAQIVRAWGN